MQNSYGSFLERGPRITCIRVTWDLLNADFWASPQSFLIKNLQIPEFSNLNKDPRWVLHTQMFQKEYFKNLSCVRSQMGDQSYYRMYSFILSWVGNTNELS